MVILTCKLALDLFLHPWGWFCWIPSWGNLMGDLLTDAVLFAMAITMLIRAMDAYRKTKNPVLLK
jgi:hypothetical protein